jgi:hypothetical protein
MLFAFVLLIASLIKSSLLLPAFVLLILPALLYSVRLYRLPNNVVSFRFLLLFYGVYFVARAIGTLAGLRFMLQRREQ